MEEAKVTPPTPSHQDTSTQRNNQAVMDTAATKAKKNTGVAIDEALVARDIKVTKITRDTKTETKAATPHQRKE